tara:strand:- start:13682 stop:14002 length:321 start_codon:yes stop_codon:yes gene_type:complete
MSFPLYYNLNNNIPKKDLTAKQKSELTENIKKLDNNTVEIVYALIQYHDNSFKMNDPLPFKGIKSNDKNNLCDIQWNISDLPISLRQILYKFIDIHLKSEKEDVKR